MTKPQRNDYVYGYAINISAAKPSILPMIRPTPAVMPYGYVHVTTLATIHGTPTVMPMAIFTPTVMPKALLHGYAIRLLPQIIFRMACTRQKVSPGLGGSNDIHKQ